MNEQFKNKQNEVALRYGFQSWSSIKWFDLQQRFEHDGIKVHPFDVLLEEVVKEFQDEVYNAGFFNGVQTVESSDLHGYVPVTGASGRTLTYVPGEYALGTVETVDETPIPPKNLIVEPTIAPAEQLKATKRKKKEDNNA
jgi:hypothetical protein